MKKQIINSLLVCATAVVFTGCAKRAVIDGKVADVQGNLPVSGVLVTEDGTQFKATTDAQGHYNISYLPGHVTLTFTHTGYLSKSIFYDLATRDYVPASTVSIISYPHPEALESYIKDVIPQQRGPLVAGGSYLLGDLMQVLEVKIGEFTQRAPTEVTAPVTITCKAKDDIGSESDVAVGFGGATGIGGQKNGQIWTHTFLGEFEWSNEAANSQQPWQFIGIAK